MGQRVPLYAWDDTHAKTLDLLERNDYFGAKKSQITLIKVGLYKFANPVDP
jgi:hypothetical protein